MNTNFKKYLTICMTAVFIAFTSCIGDLNTIPLDQDVVTSASVYKDPANYKMVLAKLYAGLAVSGQIGPHGNNDLSGLDEGFGQYLRALWYAQQLPTDEAVIGWNDATLRDYHDIDWTSTDGFITNLYYRIFYQISLSNEFIRETTEDKLKERGIDGTNKTNIEGFRYEARFLRALSYYHAVDLFGSVPFVTEDDKVGSFFPKQISRADLFKFVEKELLEIETKLPAPRANEYARADQAAVWMLLAKLYLNAEVYIGQPKYTECLTYLNKVIGAGYTLEPKYQNLFLADNHKSKEIIFPVAFDGLRTKTWGGTTFIIAASVGGSMKPADFGIASGWGGLRVTKEFVAKFLDITKLKSAIISLKSAAVYPVIYVPGGYQAASNLGKDWDPATAPTLASVKSDKTYEGYVYVSKDNQELKFTEGPNWDVNYGDNGADGTLEPNGANIKIAKTGYYKINVDLNKKTYTVVKTDWGIIGSATADGWNSDQNMTFDPATQLWTIIIVLVKGDIKFRANDDWAINYGDNGADGTLELNGANIAVAQAGKYEIKVKLGAPDYTFTIKKFSSDSRGMFYTDGQKLEIDDLFEFTNGYAMTKWKNVTSAGVKGQDQTHADTDFPMFRLADAYLMYAEAVLRGGTGGSSATALQYVNALRTRAYGDTEGNITQSALTLNFILDERARELYWEAQRRSDLVRFKKFTGGDYIWAWKGGIKAGKAVDAKYDLYPLAASDVAANINLKQNPGY